MSALLRFSRFVIAVIRQGERILAKAMDETILEHLKYVEGVECILGKFYYLSQPRDLVQAIAAWLEQATEGKPHPE